MKFLNKKYQEKYKIDDNIIKLKIDDNVTKIVSNFYNKNPFPNYNNMESIENLREQVFKNKFLKDFLNLISVKKNFLEVGAGTCQLSIALSSVSNLDFLALDPTENSLKLGVDFAKKNNLKNISFLNADIFQDPIKESYFDVVWASGVLHHTKDTFKSMKIILNWLKEDGLLVIGLYNLFGRKRTHLRQFIYKLLGKKSLANKYVMFFDPYLRRNKLSEDKINAWISDQYEHPVERSHTIDEVLKFFDKHNVEFLGSIPDAQMRSTYIGINNFDGKEGDYLARILSQLGMNFTNLGTEGGLYMMIGKKKFK